MKENKVESFSLERLVSDSNFESGNVYYDSGGGRHAPHLDLHVNRVGMERKNYRLYNPSGGDIFPMNPGQNKIYKG